MVYFWLTAGVA